jgi:hypothetical protein
VLNRYFTSIGDIDAARVSACFDIINQVVDDLQAIDSSLNIFTFCQKIDQGYTQDKFNELGSQSKIIAIRKLISEVDIACNSQIFVGCYKSNVSRYVALAHKHPKQCYSADAQKNWDPC